MQNIKILAKIESYKTYNHNPPHYFKSGEKYFLTGATYLKRKCLNTDEIKKYLLGSIKKGCDNNGWILQDWVILDNHYHLMLDAPENANTLSKMMNEIHKYTAKWYSMNIKKINSNEKLFHNYWDSCITYENSYYARLNYIYYNPIKHGYTNNIANYIWCSYNNRMAKEKAYLDNLHEKYPFEGINVKDEY